MRSVYSPFHRGLTALLFRRRVFFNLSGLSFTRAFHNQIHLWRPVLWENHFMLHSRSRNSISSLAAYKLLAWPFVSYHVTGVYEPIE